MMKEDWVDFYISEEKVFFTKKEPDGIHLYTQNNKYEKRSVYLVQVMISDINQYSLQEKISWMEEFII